VRAVAKSKALHQEYVQRCRGRVDDGLFNQNCLMIERQEAEGGSSSAPATPGGVRYGKDAEKEKQKALASRGTRNPSLAMDRRRSLSVGGLGGDPEGLGRNDSHSKGCGCIIS